MLSRACVHPACWLSEPSPLTACQKPSSNDSASLHVAFSRASAIPGFCWESWCYTWQRLKRSRKQRSGAAIASVCHAWGAGRSPQSASDDGRPPKLKKPHRQPWAPCVFRRCLGLHESLRRASADVLRSSEDGKRHFSAPRGVAASSWHSASEQVCNLRINTQPAQACGVDLCFGRHSRLVLAARQLPWHCGTRDAVTSFPGNSHRPHGCWPPPRPSAWFVLDSAWQRSEDSPQPSLAFDMQRGSYCKDTDQRGKLGMPKRGEGAVGLWTHRNRASGLRARALQKTGFCAGVMSCHRDPRRRWHRRDRSQGSTELTESCWCLKLSQKVGLPASYAGYATCSGLCGLSQLKHLGWHCKTANSGRVMPGALADFGRGAKHLTLVPAAVLGPRGSGFKAATKEVIGMLQPKKR